MYSWPFLSPSAPSSSAYQTLPRRSEAPQRASPLVVSLPPSPPTAAAPHAPVTPQQAAPIPAPRSTDTIRSNASSVYTSPYVEPVPSSSTSSSPSATATAAAAASSTASSPSGNGGMDDSQTFHECIVCYEKPVNSVLYTCGHMCMCYECALQQWRGRGGGQCPICRAQIRDVIRPYRS